VILHSARLSGEVTVPRSKSVQHRELICQALCGQYPIVENPAEDVVCTMAALQALRAGENIIDCGQSGSTLRFLLPLAAAMGRVGTVFTGTGRLLERPIPGGLPFVKLDAGWQVTAPLTGGTYNLDGSRTSQITSGLLLALPLLDRPSTIHLRDAVSAGYNDLTAAVLQRYGVTVEKTSDGWYISAPQKHLLTEMASEGDWSAGAWYYAVNALQGDGMEIHGLRPNSYQPDSAIIDYVNKWKSSIDVSTAPDIFPALALIAALREGEVTRFTCCSYLRGKESDRLAGVCGMLCAMGADVTVHGDTVTVCGCKVLQGGASVDAAGDHRMAFLAAFAALFCREPIVLTGGECVGKSYPDFWKDYIALGGCVEE